jgi:Ion channel
VIHEELTQLMSWEERHRRLLARLAIVLMATIAIDALGSVLVYLLERGADGTEIRSFGDSVFFTTVQLLTVSSQLRNPLTPWGRVVDILLEVWAVIVVAGSAGAIASFFSDS